VHVQSGPRRPRRRIGARGTFRESR
jgi:hypothetical protein